MKKVVEVLKKKNLDILILIISLVTILTFIVLIESGDELWNFANSYKMFKGYKIYEELNVIITPLFFYIAQLFFKIFGANLLAFRIYNVVIFTVFFMLIYFIFKSLKIVRRRASFYTFVILCISKPLIMGEANYNILVFVPILIAILLIIKEKDNLVNLGILLALTFLIKQNIFIYFAIGIFIYKFINRKNVFKDLFKIYIISFVGIFLFLIYMYFDNNLYNFINFCFLGISEFGAKNFFIAISGTQYIYISAISVIFSFIIIYNKKINIDEEIINHTKILISFGIPMLLISYPIANYYHMILSSAILLVELLYLVDSILIKNIDIKIKTEKMTYITIILIYIIYVIFLLFSVKQNLEQKNIVYSKGIFYGSIITMENQDSISSICEYIEDKEKDNIDVKILCHKANMYMIHLNKNNGIFDLAFLGNLGYGGEEKLIQKIKELNNTLILVKTDEEKFFGQEARKASKYIINNYEKVDEIEEYSVFYIQ